MVIPLTDMQSPVTLGSRHGPNLLTRPFQLSAEWALCAFASSTA